MKFKWSGRSNPFEHHFGGYHGLSTSGIHLIPWQIWTISTNNPQANSQGTIWICVFLVSQTQFDIQTHNSPEFPTLNSLGFSNFLGSHYALLILPLTQILDVNCYKPTIKSPKVSHYIH
jgi:hypothetical protein